MVYTRSHSIDVHGRFMSDLVPGALSPWLFSAYQRFYFSF